MDYIEQISGFLLYGAETLETNGDNYKERLKKFFH